jgi:DNA-directed RNA polymerase subunit N (RpoN/RPB10)
MEMTVCPTCRSPISPIYDAFRFLKDKVLSNLEETENSYIDTELNQNLEPVFEILQIDRYCCRLHLTTTQLIDEL